MMNPTLKKAILFGVGAFHLTKEKLNEFVSDLEKEGALDREEGEQLVREMLKKSEERAADFKVQVEKEVRRVVQELQAQHQDGNNTASKEESKCVCNCAGGNECECADDCPCGPDCECKK